MKNKIFQFSAAVAASALFFAGMVLITRSSFGKEEAFISPSFNLAAVSVTEHLLQEQPEKIPSPDAVKIPIFIYHSVRPYIKGEDKMQDAYDVTPEFLEKQLIYLRDNGFTPITPAVLAGYVRNGTTTPGMKPVMLTFDDGWENEYVYAFPLLKKYKMTAVFFVFTNPLGKAKHFMTWEQVKEMDAAGMVIGSHTLSHPYLSHLSDAQLRKEIIESKKVLEEKLGKPVTDFASPFGFSNSNIVSIIKEAGYTTARTTYKGIYHNKEDLLSLRGILVSDSFNKFVEILNR